MEQILYAASIATVIEHYGGVWNDPSRVYSNDPIYPYAGTSMSWPIPEEGGFVRMRAYVVFANYDLPDGAVISKVEARLYGVQYIENLGAPPNRPHLFMGPCPGALALVGVNDQAAFEMSNSAAVAEMSADPGYPLMPYMPNTFTRELSLDYTFTPADIAEDNLEFVFKTNQDIDDVEPVDHYEYIEIDGLGTGLLLGAPHLIVTYTLPEAGGEEPETQIRNYPRLKNKPGVTLRIIDKRRP